MITIVSAEIVGVNVAHEGLYADDKSLSQSSIKDFAKCPHKWRYGAKVDDQTESMKWGSLVDALLFDVGAGRYIVRPDTYGSKDGIKPWNNNATNCKAWNKSVEDRGYIVVSRATMNEAETAASIIRCNPECLSLLEASRYQVYVKGVAVDSDTGLNIPLKTLIDIAPFSVSKFSNALADLKTCADGSVNRWARTCIDRGYHIQAAFELDLFNKAMNENRTQLLHIVSESESPYEVGRRELSDQFIRIGRGAYQSALELYAQCVANDEWPGLDVDGWTLIEPEPWMVLKSGVIVADSPMPF